MEHIFQKRQGLEVRLHPRRATVHGSLVHHQAKGTRCRGHKEKGAKRTANEGDSDPNRHGILGVGEHEAGPSEGVQIE